MNNEISTIAIHTVRHIYLMMKPSTARVSRKLSLSERNSGTLSRKVAVLVETEPVLLDKLSENGQLDLLMRWSNLSPCSS